MALEWIAILVFVIAFVVGMGLIKVNPLIAGVLGIFGVLVIVGLGLSVVFDSAFLLEFMKNQSWIVGGAFGFVAGGLIGLFT